MIFNIYENFFLSAKKIVINIWVMKISTNKYSKYLPIFFNVFSEFEFWFWIFLHESNGCENNDSHAQDVFHQHQANSSFIHQLIWMLNIHVSFLSFVIFISIFHLLFLLICHHYQKSSKSQDCKVAFASFSIILSKNVCPKPFYWTKIARFYLSSSKTCCDFGEMLLRIMFHSSSWISSLYCNFIVDVLKNDMS